MKMWCGAISFSPCPRCKIANHQPASCRNMWLFHHRATPGRSGGHTNRYQKPLLIIPSFCFSLWVISISTLCSSVGPFSYKLSHPGSQVNMQRNNIRHPPKKVSVRNCSSPYNKRVWHYFVHRFVISGAIWPFVLKVRMNLMTYPQKWLPTT